MLHRRELGRWPGRILALLLGAACVASNDEPDPEELLEAIRQEGDPSAVPTDHQGPPVEAGDAGPARFLPALYGAFDADRSMETLGVLDRYYRSAGDDGYEACFNHLKKSLEEIGFGSDPRLELEVIKGQVTTRSWITGEDSPAPAWTPWSASLTLESGGQERILHHFSRQGDPDRLMLPTYAPPAMVSGEVVLDYGDIRPGSVVVIEAKIDKRHIQRVRSQGGVALISSYIEPFNYDPTGEDRHLDAIKWRTMLHPAPLPIMKISPRSFETIREAVEADPKARLSLRAEVIYTYRRLRTLVATVVGDESPDEAVVIVSHLDYPGAGDNGSGVSGMLEGARVLVELLRAGQLEWPARSISIVWGAEMHQADAWLGHSRRRAVAGISAEMIGESPERTGAVARLERMPDPGALYALPPDEHTEWGAGEVEGPLQPNGLSVVARCALVDVAAHDPPWKTAENPWEGGADHDRFNARGVPGVLFWHFTSFAYHTSLDRIEMVCSKELKRTSTAVLTTALALADPLPTDLDRYLRTLNRERVIRIEAALEAEEEELAEQWREWTTGARLWLRQEILRLPPSDR